MLTYGKNLIKTDVKPLTRAEKIKFCYILPCRNRFLRILVFVKLRDFVYKFSRRQIECFFSNFFCRKGVCFAGCYCRSTRIIPLWKKGACHTAENIPASTFRKALASVFYNINLSFVGNKSICTFHDQGCIRKKPVYFFSNTDFYFGERWKNFEAECRRNWM